MSPRWSSTRVRQKRFYIYSHPKALASVQTRLEDVMLARNPSDPFAAKPEIGAELRAALRAEGLRCLRRHPDRRT